MVDVIENRCPQNHRCPLIRICPRQAIKQNGFNAPIIDKKACINCNLCVQNCPYYAVTQ